MLFQDNAKKCIPIPDASGTKIIADIIAKLHSAKLTALEKHTAALWNTSNETIDIDIICSKDPDYFSRLESTGYIQNINVSVRWNDIPLMLHPQYFADTSNNCTRLITTTSVGGGKLASCENNTRLGLISSVPLPPAALYKGRTPGITQTTDFIQPEIILHYIHVMENSYVHGHGDVYAGSVKIVPERCRWQHGLKSRKIKRRDLLSAPLYDEVFTISQFWGGGFFHSSLENLPRMAPYLDYLQRYPDIKIHMSMRHPFLPLLGLDPKRVVKGNVRAKLLYMPEGGPCSKPPIFPTQTLSSHLRKRLDTISERNTIILIKRSHRRWFRRHSSILKMLQSVASPHGYRVVEYRDDPVPEVDKTRDMFSSAFLVVAPHGAGESNLLFSAPGTVLMEGLCYEGNKINLCYRDMAESLALRYHGLVFEKDCFDITADDIKASVLQVLDLKLQGLL